MKYLGKAIIILLFLSFAENLYCQNLLSNFDISYDLADLGFCYNINKMGNNVELSCSLININIEHRQLHFGIKYDPLQFSIFYHKDPIKNIDKIYFLNPTIYWNLLFNNNIILGPFVSINYLTLNNLLTFDKTRINLCFTEYMFTGGLKFTWRVKKELVLFPNIINIDIGYKNISNIHYFYFFFGIGTKL